MPSLVEVVASAVAVLAASLDAAEEAELPQPASMLRLRAAADASAMACFAFFMCTKPPKILSSPTSHYGRSPAAITGKGIPFPMTVYSYSVHLSIMAYLI